MRTMKSLEMRGMWWLPESPKNALAGWLRFDPGSGARLELIGSYRGYEELNSTFQPPLILGVTTDGKRVSLNRCTETKTSLSMGGFLTSTFDAQMVLVGDHFTNQDELVFSKVGIQYDRLSEWSWLSGFKWSVTQDKATKKITKYAVEYSFPDTHEVAVGDLKIRFAPSFRTDGHLVERHDLRQDLFIEIESPTPLGLEQYLNELFYHMQNYLSLGVGVPVYPVAAYGIPQRKEEAEAQPETASVQFFYSVRRAPGSERSIHPSEMLFSFRDIGDAYATSLNKWFDNTKLLKPVLDLYFSTVYAPHVYLDTRFLNIAEALESYHRRTRSGQYLENSKAEAVRDALVSSLDEFKLDKRVRSTFVAKLAYINEFTLRRRLRDLLDSVKGMSLDMIPDEGEFVGRFTDTRNFLTHYDESLKDKAAKGIQLYLLAEQGRSLLELFLLGELGLSKDQCQQAMRRSRRYRNLMAML